MNYIKIQQEMLKTADKAAWKRYASNPWLYAEDKDNIIVSEGHLLVVIPKCMFFLDPVKVTKDKPQFKGAIDILAKKYEGGKAEDTQMVELKEKKKYHKFLLENGDDMYIDEDFLKYFDLKTCTFTAESKVSLLYIWEDNEVVGAVLPVKYK